MSLGIFLLNPFVDYFILTLFVGRFLLLNHFLYTDKILEEFVVLMDAQAVHLMEPTIDQILEELDVSIMYRFLQSPIGYSRSVNTELYPYYYRCLVF